MTSIAVTGVSGRIGQRLLHHLDAIPGIDRIVGIDVREPRFRPRSLEFHAADIGAADLKPVLEQVDTLVHLAFLIAPLPDESVMERVNVEGTRRLLEAAAATGVGKVVLVSSALAYGAWPNNPVPITEDAPLRPNTDLSFAVHKAEAERLLAEWRDEHPAVVATVLRPPLVLGGGTPDAVRALVRGRLPFRVRDGAPDQQFLHVEDLASAVAVAVERDLDGTFNVAPDGWLSDEDASALAGRPPRVSLPADVADRMLIRLWRSGMGDVPPGATALLQSPIVLANDRLRAAGWAPAHSNEEAILACVEESGPVSVTPRRAQLVLGIAGAVAAVGAVTWAALRRRR